MLRFKEFEYTTFKDDGLEDSSYLLGRDIFIEYEDKDSEDIKELIFSMLVESYQGSVLQVLRTRNLLFNAGYFYRNGNYEEENTMCFLSTPDTYKEVFNVKA